MVLQPCRFAFSDERDQPRSIFPATASLAGLGYLSDTLGHPESAHASSRRRNGKPSRAVADPDVIRP